MSRLQLALRVGDLEASIAFYQKLLGVALRVVVSLQLFLGARLLD
jgi:catechol 2,3-dioxygenase-like lactoylglutathione lyase family enzyme